MEQGRGSGPRHPRCIRAGSACEQVRQACRPLSALAEHQYGAEVLLQQGSGPLLIGEAWNRRQRASPHPRPCAVEKIGAGASRRRPLAPPPPRREPACRVSALRLVRGALAFPFAEATISVGTHALPLRTGAFGGMRALAQSRDPNGNSCCFSGDSPCPPPRQSAPGCCLLNMKKKTILGFAIVQFLGGRIAPPHRSNLRPLCLHQRISASRRGLHRIEPDFLIYASSSGDYLSPDVRLSCRSAAGSPGEPFPAPARQDSVALKHHQAPAPKRKPSPGLR